MFPVDNLTCLVPFQNFYLLFCAEISNMVTSLQRIISDFILHAEVTFSTKFDADYFGKDLSGTTIEWNARRKILSYFGGKRLENVEFIERQQIISCSRRRCYYC